MSIQLRDLLSPNRPWLHLLYLGLFFFRWLYLPPTLSEALISLAAMIGFVAGYVVVMRRLDWTVYALSIVSVAVGFAFVPVNMGGAVYIIFAGAMLARLPVSRTRQIAILALALLAAPIAWAMGQPLFFIVSLYLFGGLALGGSLMSARRERETFDAEERQSRAARRGAEAERQRIARDLHDLLGHTLSVVTLKADLATRLFDADPDRARAELAEIQSISRTALAEVREAVTGLRDRSLEDAMAEAAERLEAAGLDVTRKSIPLTLSAGESAVLAMVVREAATNILRHARAQIVGIAVDISPDGVRVQIEDDGVGGAVLTGGGLSGLKERLRLAGGDLSLTAGPGGRGSVVQASLPIREDSHD